MDEWLIGIQFGIGDAYGRGLLEGVGRFLREHPGCRGIRLGHDDGRTDFWLRHPRFRGVLARVYHEDERWFYRKVRGLGVPVILVSNTLERDETAAVHVDDEAVGKMAAAYFLDKGFRNLFYLTFPGDDSCSSAERWRGFSREAASRNQHASRVAIDQHFEPWLRDLPRPAAVLARNDHAGRILLEHAHAAGLNIPHDIAVLGVDNDAFESVLCPFDLSSIELPLSEIGYQACALLAEGPPTPDIHRVLSPLRIVERASTDVVAFEDPAIRRAMEHVRDHAAGPLDVAAVAGAAFVSRRVLERRFRARVGRTVREEIVLARLDRAVHLLETTDQPVADIAEAAGFPDYRAFLREFRRHRHTTPTAWKRPR